MFAKKPTTSLPPHWKHVKRGGVDYYYNTVTRQTAASLDSLPPPLPQGWEEAIDKKTGTRYYWNTATRETRETPPEAAAEQRSPRRGNTHHASVFRLNLLRHSDGLHRCTGSGLSPSVTFGASASSVQAADPAGIIATDSSPPPPPPPAESPRPLLVVESSLDSPRGSKRESVRPQQGSGPRLSRAGSSRRALESPRGAGAKLQRAASYDNAASEVSAAMHRLMLEDHWSSLRLESERMSGRMSGRMSARGDGGAWSPPTEPEHVWAAPVRPSFRKAVSSIHFAWPSGPPIDTDTADAAAAAAHAAANRPLRLGRCALGVVHSDDGFAEASSLRNSFADDGSGRGSGGGRSGGGGGGCWSCAGSNVSVLSSNCGGSRSASVTSAAGFGAGVGAGGGGGGRAGGSCSCADALTALSDEEASERILALREEAVKLRTAGHAGAALGKLHEAKRLQALRDQMGRRRFLNAMVPPPPPPPPPHPQTPGDDDGSGGDDQAAIVVGGTRALAEASTMANDECSSCSMAAAAAEAAAEAEAKEAADAATTAKAAAAAKAAAEAVAEPLSKPLRLGRHGLGVEHNDDGFAEYVGRNSVRSDGGGGGGGDDDDDDDDEMSTRIRTLAAEAARLRARGHEGAALTKLQQAKQLQAQRALHVRRRNRGIDAKHNARGVVRLGRLGA